MSDIMSNIDHLGTFVRNVIKELEFYQLCFNGLGSVMERAKTCFSVT